MPIEFNCEACTRLLRVPDGTQGKQCQCPGCGVLLKIPAQTTAASLPPVGNLPEVAICIACPKCRHELICDPSLVGTKGQCRNCKHIFLITEDPEQAAMPVAPGWIFNCPKCDQLFEGNEAMRGRRGKCHVCGEVFAIQLKMVGEVTASKSAAHAAVKPSPDASKVAPSAKLDPKPVTKATPPAIPSSGKTPAAHSMESNPLSPAAAPSKATATPSKASTSTSINSTTPGTDVPKPSGGSAVPASKAGAETRRVAPSAVSAPVPTNSPAIRFQCLSCNGTLEVAGDSAGQITFCPFCQEQLEIPRATELASATSGVATGSLFDTNLDPFATTSGLGTLDDLPALQPVGYQPKMGRSRAASRGVPTKYIACGVATVVCALLSMVVELYQGLQAAQKASTSPDPAESLAAAFVAVCIGVAFCIAIVQLIGGVAMIRGRGLIIARTASVLNLMPCICINFPIGIWGTVLTFSSEAQQDFNN